MPFLTLIRPGELAWLPALTHLEKHEGQSPGGAPEEGVAVPAFESRSEHKLPKNVFLRLVLFCSLYFCTNFLLLSLSQVLFSF